jgi:hypothetical protein
LIHLSIFFTDIKYIIQREREREKTNELVIPQKMRYQKEDVYEGIKENERERERDNNSDCLLTLNSNIFIIINNSFTNGAFIFIKIRKKNCKNIYFFWFCVFNTIHFARITRMEHIKENKRIHTL